MDYVYMFTPDGGEWEDICIYISEEDAIIASKKYPSMRIDIFEKSITDTHTRYIPTYAYYLNGEIIDSQYLSKKST